MVSNMKPRRARIALLTACSVMGLSSLPPIAFAQTATAPVETTTPPPQPERYLLQVAQPLVAVYQEPDSTQPIIAQLEQGMRVEGDMKRAGGQAGQWYRVKLNRGDIGWVLNAPTEQGDTLIVQAFPADQNLPPKVDPASPDATLAEQSVIDRGRPQGAPIEPALPVIDPQQVEPPTRWVQREEVPVPDRWRIMKTLGLLPYQAWDPYNPNVLKGDLPVLQKELGEDWFFNLTAVSDTLYESRRLPTPVGIQSTLDAGSNGTLGRGEQSTFSETGIISLALIKGDTTFRPPDYEFRFVPVVNINRTNAAELRVVNINPAAGTHRDDDFVGVQELFIDKHLRDVSTRYDFDSLRIGIQPFNADFRGFLFIDQAFGIRLFGTRDNNQWQYNLAWLRRLEKDTNSGLNDIEKPLRNDDIYVFNAYRQDFPVLGFTTQGTVLHNINREGDASRYFNKNGFLERPAIFGTGRSHNYEVTYLGLNGDGHFGRWNLNTSLYYALGIDQRGMLSGQKEDIDAYFGAFELSRDFDWFRLRTSGLWASGDKDPFDKKAGGFDAVLENPLFAGADTSYWIRQSVPLIGGGGTALSMRNGVLANLRTSREHGQSNFTNPGLHLLGFGADLDISPQLRLIGNANYLEFDNLSSLVNLRNQRMSSVRIGWDVSMAVQYRPKFSQNIVINASYATLLPDQGLRELYGNAVDANQYSALLNIVLTF